MAIEHELIQINEYDLTGEADAYADAIARLADRTEREGSAGVLQYRFYVDQTSRAAGATIIYADADAWRAHHDLAYQWEEMGELQSTVQLKRLTLFGPLTRDAEQWLANAGISYSHYPDPAAQFVRD